jgi:GLPGLI family protein
MIKLFFTVACIMGAYVGTDAQKPDSAYLMIHYKFSFIRDTTNRTHPYTENMVLFLGRNASSYRSYDAIVADQQFKKAYADAVASSPDGHAMINRHGGGSGTQYYQYPGAHTLLIKDGLMFNDYLIESALPDIDWKIGNDTATFGGLHCQKAMGHFRGRDYIAWFCPDLPVHTGPWKLNGLPGVIVDARDTKNEVVFAFDGVESTVASPMGPSVTGNTDEKDLPPILRGLNYNPNLIVPPKGLVKTTQKEFDKLKAAMDKDPQGFAQAANVANESSANAGGLKQDHIMVAPKGSGPVVNNAIELPEQ